jgi:phosphate transport system substrate-binding protein
MKRIALMILVLSSFALASTTLKGMGATFPAPLYEVMFQEYAKIGGANIQYEAAGSGAGQVAILADQVDFAASDAFISDERLKSTPRKLLHIPTALGAVVPAYNLAGLTKQLRFDGALLADIYLGKIKKWNDPAIVKQNPNAALPDLVIAPVYRSDGSGTTAIFVDFLAKTSKTWADMISKGPQTQVNFPVGVPGLGNAGVAAGVRQVAGAIGYVEASFAKRNNLQFGLVKNASGRYLDGSSLKAIEAAASVIKLPADTRVSLVNVGGAAYPIAGFTWLLVYADQKYGGRSQEQGKALADLLWWITHDGQKFNEALGYGQLPTGAVSRASSIISGMNYGGVKLR